MSYLKNSMKALIILALFIGVCFFSLDYFLVGSGYDSAAVINKTLLGKELQGCFIIMFWFVLFLVPEWTFF